MVDQGSLSAEETPSTTTTEEITQTQRPFGRCSSRLSFRSDSGEAADKSGSEGEKEEKKLLPPTRQLLTKGRREPAIGLSYKKLLYPAAQKVFDACNDHYAEDEQKDRSELVRQLRFFKAAFKFFKQENVILKGRLADSLFPTSEKWSAQTTTIKIDGSEDGESSGEGGSTSGDGSSTGDKSHSGSCNTGYGSITGSGDGSSVGGASAMGANNGSEADWKNLGKYVVTRWKNGKLQDECADQKKTVEKLYKDLARVKRTLREKEVTILELRSMVLDESNNSKNLKEQLASLQKQRHDLMKSLFDCASKLDSPSCYGKETSLITRKFQDLVTQEAIEVSYHLKDRIRNLSFELAIAENETEAALCKIAKEKETKIKTQLPTKAKGVKKTPGGKFELDLTKTADKCQKKPWSGIVRKRNQKLGLLGIPDGHVYMAPTWRGFFIGDSLEDGEVVL